MSVFLIKSAVGYILFRKTRDVYNPTYMDSYIAKGEINVSFKAYTVNLRHEEERKVD